MLTKQIYSPITNGSDIRERLTENRYSVEPHYNLVPEKYSHNRCIYYLYERDPFLVLKPPGGGGTPI